MEKKEKVELLGNARSTTGDEPKCIDCKHYNPYPADKVLIFSSPKHRCTAAVDLATGKTIETDCYAMRHDSCECGQKGKLFKKAPEKPPPPPPPSPPEPDDRTLKALLVVLGVLAILALIYWAYDKDTSPPHEKETDQPRVIKTGEITLKKVSMKDGTCCVTARTQLLAIGKRSLWQVEASPGDWRDCGNDCEQTLREALGK